MKHIIVAALLALSAGVAFASDVTSYDKEQAAQWLAPKETSAPKAGQAQPTAATVATACTCKR